MIVLSRDTAGDSLIFRGEKITNQMCLVGTGVRCYVYKNEDTIAQRKTKIGSDPTLKIGSEMANSPKKIENLVICNGRRNT